MAANNDRLTGLDASFLHLEDGRSHMHVAAVMLFWTVTFYLVTRVFWHLP